MSDFYIDNDVALEVAGLLRAAGHTAVTARDLGREGSTDDEQLLVASQDGRIFVTHSEHDYILLHDARQRWSAAWGVAAQHAGVLLCDTLPESPLVTSCGLAWYADPAARPEGEGGVRGNAAEAQEASAQPPYSVVTVCI